MKEKNKFSNDDLREKVDGFQLNNENEALHENKFITTDQGVYYPPDSNYSSANKNKS